MIIACSLCLIWIFENVNQFSEQNLILTTLLVISGIGFSKGFYSKGAQYFWWEINEKIKEEKDFFIFSNKEIEIQKMDLISNLITKNTVSGFKKESRLSRVKHRIQKSFPKIFKIYLKLRQAKL